MNAVLPYGLYARHEILLLQEQKRRLFDAVIADPAASGGLTLEELRLLLG